MTPPREAAGDAIINPPHVTTRLGNGSISDRLGWKSSIPQEKSHELTALAASESRLTGHLPPVSAGSWTYLAFEDQLSLVPHSTFSSIPPPTARRVAASAIIHAHARPMHVVTRCDACDGDPTLWESVP